MLRFSCPGCGTSLSAPEDCAGRSSRCRTCGQAFQIPVPVASIVSAPAAPPTSPPPQSDAAGLTGVVLSGLGLAFAVLAWFAFALAAYIAAPLSAVGAFTSSFSRTGEQRILGILLGLAGLILSLVAILVLRSAIAELLDKQG